MIGGCARQSAHAWRFTPIRFSADVHYLVNYLLRDPVQRATDEWLELSWSAFQQGRRPEAGLAERPFLGWFTPFQTHVSPRVRVSADALPFRPVRGVYVTISAIEDGDPTTSAFHTAPPGVFVVVMLSAAGLGR